MVRRLFTAMVCSVPAAAPIGCPSMAVPGASKLTVAASASIISSQIQSDRTARKRPSVWPWSCTPGGWAFRPSAGHSIPSWARSIPGSKKARWAGELLPALVRLRAEGRPGRPARVISFDEMWSYVGARRKGKRREVWIWTAVVEERDGSRWVDFEVGDRSEETFLRLYGRLPEAGPSASSGVPQRRLPSV